MGFLEGDKLNELCGMKDERSYKSGDRVISQGDSIMDFMYLKEGMIKVFRTDDMGKDQIISIGKPFDFISLLSIFSETHYNYSVSTLEDSVICSMRLNVVLSMAKKHSQLAFNLMKTMSRVTDKIIIDNLEVRQKHLRGRIALIIIRFANEIYHKTSFELPISRKEFGELIGMTTENVIRTLSEFRKDNLIRIYGKTIEILDVDRLKKISALG